MNRRGMLIVLSGPSGSGKGTIIKSLLQQREDTVLSISVTTRAPRPGEEDGVHYFFRTREEFEELIRRNALLEFAEYNGNYYGTPQAYVEEQLGSGRDVILEIEIQGALKVKEKLADTLLLFVTPPSAQELKKRLEIRGTETPESVRSRLARANEEAQGILSYDYLLVNDDLETCVDVMHHVTQSEHHRMQRNHGSVQKIVQELKAL